MSVGGFGALRVSNCSVPGIIPLYCGCPVTINLVSLRDDSMDDEVLSENDMSVFPE
jgi:hypothetical protein